VHSQAVHAVSLRCIADRLHAHPFIDVWELLVVVLVVAEPPDLQRTALHSL
jgi:hypothetical protein